MTQFIKNTTFAAIAVFAIAPPADAQLLQFNTLGNLGTETSEPSVINDVGVLPSTLVLGTGITPTANGNRFGGSNTFDTGDTNPTTLSESIADNDYFEFTLTPASGFQVDVTSFSFVFDRSLTGPSGLALRSSADSFAADLGQLTGVPNGNTTTFSQIPISNTALTGTTAPITFRLYAFGATAAAGAGGFDTAAASLVNNVVLNGSATAVPEPSAALAMLSGAAILVARRRRRA